MSLNTMESEYYALTEATMEALYLTQILFELTMLTRTPIIYCDNTATIALAKTDKFHGRAKHINVRHHFIREHLLLKHINIKWIDTKHQLADIFTKNVIGPQFNVIRNQILSQVQLT
jgi:hypothetical protein